MAGWDDDDFEVPDFTTTSDAPPARDALTAAGLLPGALSAAPSNESDDWFGPRAPSVLPEDTAALRSREAERGGGCGMVEGGGAAEGVAWLRGAAAVGLFRTVPGFARERPHGVPPGDTGSGTAARQDALDFDEQNLKRPYTP